MVEKVDQVDPVLGLKDSSQVERWEAALRNPKGFIASQAPFDSTEPISEEKEEEKPNVLPSMVKVTETRTGEPRVTPVRALSSQVHPRLWSQPTVLSDTRRSLFTPISARPMDDDPFGNTTDRDAQGQEIRPDVKFSDDPFQPAKAVALGASMGLEFPIDIATKWIWQSLYTGVDVYKEIMNAPLNLFDYYTNTPLSPQESKSLEKIANRWDQYNKEAIPMLVESFFKKGWWSPIKLLSDVSHVPVHKRHASFTPISFGVSGALPFGGVWATTHKARKFLDGAFRGAAIYSQLRKPVVASGLGLRTAEGSIPFGPLSSEARLNMLTAARLAFEEARIFRPKLPGLEQITTYSQLAQNNKFIINPDLERALEARSAINLILQKRKYAPGFTYEDARKMATRNYNNATLGLGMGAGHAIASQFTDNEMTQMVFGMMAGIPVGKGRIRTDKEEGKLGSLGRHGVKARKANITLRTLRGANTIGGQIGVLFLTKAFPLKFWSMLKNDPQEFINILTRKDHNPVAKTLIAMNFGFSIPQITKTARESMKTTRYAVRKHRILEDNVKTAEIEIENISKAIKDTGKTGTDVHKKIIDEANAKLEKAQKELEHFVNEKTKQKILQLNKKGEIEGNPLHLVDQLLMAPSGRMEAVTSMVNAMKTTSKDFEETLGVTLKSLSDISKHTGMDMDQISLTIGQASNAIVFSQYIESSLNAVRVSLLDNGYRLDKTLLGLLDNEIAAHQDNLAKAVESLRKSLDTITLSGKDIPKEVTDFIQTLDNVKNYHGKHIQTIFEDNRKRLLAISKGTLESQVRKSGIKYEEESQAWFRHADNPNFLNRLNASLYNRNFNNFKRETDSKYQKASDALNNFKDKNGDPVAFSVAFNPKSVFGTTSLLSGDQRQIFNSLFENRTLREYGSYTILPENLREEMIINGVLKGNLENATDVNYFKKVKTDIIDPYVDSIVSNKRKQVEDQGLVFDEKEFREQYFDFFINKDDTGKGIFDQDAINNMLQFLVKQGDSVESRTFIPMTINIDTLVQVKKKIRSDIRRISNLEKKDADNYNQSIKLQEELKQIDNAISQSINSIDDVGVRRQAENALGLLTEADNYYAKNANHFYGGSVKVLGEDVNAHNSPLHKAWRALNPDSTYNKEPSKFIKEFIESPNPELAKHQFDMIARLPEMPGTEALLGEVKYDPEIVISMIKSLGAVTDATDIKKFTDWFDEIVYNLEVPPPDIRVTGASGDRAPLFSYDHKAKSNIQQIKKHYDNWKNFNNDRFTLAYDQPAKIINEADKAEVRLTLNYISEIEKSFKEMFDLGGLGQLGNIRNEDELVKALLEKHVIPVQSVEQVKEKLPSGYAEKLFIETNRVVSKEVTDAVERAAQFESSDYSISRLDLFLTTLQQERAAKRISEEKYEKTLDFLQRAVATYLYNNAIRKTTTKRLQVKADELNELRSQYMDKDLAAEDGYVRDYTDKADMENWLRKVHNFTDADFTNRVDLSDAFDTTFYSSFLQENKQALNMIFESKPENLKFIEDIFQVSLALDPVSGQAMVSALSGGRYTEQMAAGRLYNAMKGVVSYRYLLMEAGFMKAAAIQQGMVADILADPNLAESVHKMLHLGIFEDKTFDIIWTKILGRLGRMGLTHTTLDYDEVKEEFEKQSEQAAEYNDIIKLTSI